MKYQDLVKTIRKGGVGILPTDTIYGLVGLALAPVTVERIYKLKKRSDGKPFIVLIGSWQDLEKINVEITPDQKKILKKVWPGPVSVVLPCDNPRLAYLHQNKNLAIRWAKNNFLNRLIKKTGPLVAPSANPEGLKPAETITEAKKYFGAEVDFYFANNGKRLTGQSSTLIEIKNGKINILRQGAKTSMRMFAQEEKN